MPSTRESIAVSFLGNTGGEAPTGLEVPQAAPAKASQAPICGPAGSRGLSPGLPSSRLCAFESRNVIPQLGITEKYQMEE